MKALLLAAGLGSRLRPLTNEMPKCLVPIGGKPLLEIWIEQLIDAGVDEFFINIHAHAQMVHTFFQQNDFDCVINCLDEAELLGTGGTLRKNAQFFVDGPFLCAHADNFCLADFKAFFAAHSNRSPEVEITMMTFVTDQPQSCGVVETNGYGIVTKFQEKVSNPTSNRANAAVFVMEPSVAHRLGADDRDVIDFCADELPKYVGRMQTWANDIYHLDIGTPENYSRANRDWQKMVQNKKGP
jgi:mannose-1-phosphate guanylyltransferase